MRVNVMAVTVRTDKSTYGGKVAEAHSINGLEAVTKGYAVILDRHPTIAFFCSVKCPGEPIVQAYDFARAMRDTVTVISGFQSPIEKDCLDILLCGSKPVIICPARSLHGMRLPTTWKTAMAQGRLLLLSPFAKGIRRPTVELSEKRNEFVANLADYVLFAYANPGGKTEALARKVVEWGKPVFAFDSKENANLISLGIQATDHEAMIDRMKTIGALT